MKYLSPAKLNLFLHIINKRVDGYHELETIFQLINLYDEIDIKKTTNGKINRLGANNNIVQNDDLIIQAANLLKKTTNTKFGADISINKKIPIGGGLGGGSSNAATVLLALNDLWNTNLTNNQLQKLGLQLGADVPVFITQKNCFATGIGEKLTPIILAKYYFLIINPNEHISTKEIFSHFALTNTPRQGKIPSFLQAINLKNDCLEAVLQSSDGVKNAFNYLNLCTDSICSAKLSGTGSCVFTVFSSKESAKIALKNYKCNNSNAFVVEGIS